MFVRTEEIVTLRHRILADERGPADHAPLVVSILAPGMAVPATKWAIKSGSKEEGDFLSGVQAKLSTLLEWQGVTPLEVDEVVNAISGAFAEAWNAHAVESRLCKRSKGWWTMDCSDALRLYRTTRDREDWKAYRRVMRGAKRAYFEEKIHEVASTNRRPWDLTAWVRNRNLPTFEAISYRGVQCKDLESLWEALDGTYNAATGRAVDLSYLDPYAPLPEREWVAFSPLELREALSGCSSHSAPGPDHITWSHLKFWCRSDGVAALLARVADACVVTGHWPDYFKQSLSVIIPKPGKASYGTPKSFRPIVLLNTLGKLVEKMLARRLQFDGVAHGAFQPMQFGGVAQRSTEDAGIYLTHLVRAGWARGLQTSVVFFFFFESTIYNAVRDRSPRAEGTSNIVTLRLSPLIPPPENPRFEPLRRARPHKTPITAERQIGAHPRCGPKARKPASQR